MTGRRVFRWLLALLFTASLGLANVRAHRPGDVDTTIAQLAFLERALSQGAAQRMQALFPEGYVFVWALYGLASAEVAGALDETDERRARLLGEARRALRELGSGRARATFHEELDPPYGAFLSSWSLYLQASTLRAAGPGGVEADFLASFDSACARFAEALQRSETPFLPSYRRAAWPADTAVGVAALGIHDALLPPVYGETIDRWVRRARVRLDPKWRALAHAADPVTGAPQGGVRGSSLALMSRVLVDADPDFAGEQYDVLRRHFVDYRFGVPGVREYPAGAAGSSDVDSGPLLLGYSGPAIVVGAAAARAHGDESTAAVLLGAIEVVGLPIEWANARRYLGGGVPVGDGFIAWARSTERSDRAGADREPAFPGGWALPAQGVSAVLACLVLVWAFRSGRRVP